MNGKSRRPEATTQGNDRRPRRLAALTAVVALAALRCGVVAAPPEQFAVWGTAGPDLPSAPDGWTEVASPPEGLPALVPTAAEQTRGYVLFARDPFMPMPYNCVPASSERTRQLRAFCARGEYESLSFGIHALQDLREVNVSVGELRSDTGATIPADQTDVRVVRCLREIVDAKAKTYRMCPFLLEKRAAFDIAAGSTAQVWLTVRAPDDASSGNYAGTVNIRPVQGEPAELALRLRVLPFALPPAPAEIVMSMPRPPEDDVLLRKQLVDLREHGMTGLESMAGVEVASRNRVFGDDDVAATVARCRRLMRAYRGVFGEWRFPVTFEVGHQIAYYWDPAKSWFVFWPHSPEIESDLLKAIDVVTKLAADEGWPPLRVYALDEAGAHGLLDEAVYYYGLIKQRDPELTSWTTIGGGMAMGHDEIGQLSSVVDFLSTNRFTPEIAQALVARGKPFGVYNGAGNTPAGARFFFGFYGWKTAAAQLLQWAYSFGNSAFEGSGLRQADEGFIYSAPDGPLPSLMWEAAREGVDDYRYLQLLRRTAVQRDAPEALTETMGQIPWTFQAMAYGDRTPPPHPSTLRKWRERIAEAILALPPAEQPDAADGARSPFDYAWLTPPAETVSYGEELFPTASFEADLKPWRVEAWKGQGSGELDPSQAHEGAQSVKVTVPADSGNEAVTVLVWPTWGGGGLNLTLQGDCVYEMAAWVKLSGRSALPDLRVSLPAGAERSSSTGQSKPTDEGWQRVWKRVETAFPAQATYLAVWVQGPGTVWIDDLSLREVIPPPVRVALDQPDYDDLDRLAIATIGVSKRVTPATLRIGVYPERGAPVSEVTVPFRTQATIAPTTAPAGALALIAPADLHECHAVLDPSALAPGAYRLRAELLDTNANGLGDCDMPFRRLPGGRNSH
jgi:hypothetical protein